MTEQDEIINFRIQESIVRKLDYYGDIFDNLGNGVVIHNVSQKTTNALHRINSLKYIIHRFGWRARTDWLDGNTVKVTWHK